MTDQFAIRPSSKCGLDSPEHYIVTFGPYVCLRILGRGTSYEVMTATADEDDGRFLAAPNQALLVDLACRTARALGGEPVRCLDRLGRRYIKIGTIRDAEGADLIIETLLRLADEEPAREEGEVAGSNETGRELRDIYDAISPDGSGEPAYLGDGLWLDGNGRLSDRGR